MIDEPPRRLISLLSVRESIPPRWCSRSQGPPPSASPTRLSSSPRIDSQVARNGLPTIGETCGPSRRPLSWITFEHVLRQWGMPELAERATHDLFFNVRVLAPALPRVRLFGAFTGCLPPAGMEHADEVRPITYRFRGRR